MIELRRLTRADLPRLGSLLAAPHVERWWREPHDPASLEARYGPAIDGPDQTALFVVFADGEEIGFAQSYRIAGAPGGPPSSPPPADRSTPPAWTTCSAGPSCWGRGRYPRLLVQLAEVVSPAEYPEVGWVVVDVAQANRRSWRALEKAGFHRTFAGTLSSADPSDQGPAYPYLLAHRPGRSKARGVVAAPRNSSLARPALARTSRARWARHTPRRPAPASAVEPQARCATSRGGPDGAA